MKVTCNQTSLARQLAIVGRLVSAKPGLPILANVLVEADGSKLQLTATDLELGVNTWIGAEVAEEGKITIPARTLSEFVNSLPEGKVELAQEKQNIKVTTTNNEAQFNTMPPDDFPAVPGVDNGELVLKVKPEDMKKAADRVAVAAASDDSRPVLTGIKMEAEGSDLAFIAVDGFRLSKQVVELEDSVKEKTELLVPAKAIEEVARVIDDLTEEDGDSKSKKKKKDEPVEVYLLKDKNQVIFRYKEVDLISRVIDGQFPEYQQIIPTGFKTKLEMEEEQIQNAVRIVNIFARGAIGNKAIMEFDPENKQVKVSAALVEVGENESNFEATGEGEKLKIAFSTKYLTDMLSCVDGDKIIFEGSGAVAPGVFKSKGDDSFLHIIMPMRQD